MKPHAFVAMPFGTKPGHDGKPIDFNRVYREFIQPALALAGCEAFRADEEQRAGDIRRDMFQELLVADLVVADLTLDNPNVWYEVGVRHALRARGVVLVYGPRPSQPFDTFSDRKLAYTLVEGTLDPQRLPAEIEKLAAMARATLDASAERKVSPVYALLDHLQEPKWRDLLLAERNEFSAAFGDWERAMRIARQKNRPGDLLVLAEETPTQALRLEAKRMAGNSLLKLKQHGFALEQFEQALALEPGDQASLEKKTLCLGRLGRAEEAREWAKTLTDRFGADPEVWSLSGRVEKEDWIARWRDPGGAPSDMRQRAGLERDRLDSAIAPYLKAFKTDARHFYSGINALTLLVLCKHTGGAPAESELSALAGGVRWAAATAVERNAKDYWARATLAEWNLLLQPPAEIEAAFRSAVALADRDWFALDSTRQTLAVLRDLDFRPAETSAALAIVDGELSRSEPPFEPRQVILFSGHMMDAPARPQPRFPPEKESAAIQAVSLALDELQAGTTDLALCQGAAGGDLIFLEACQQRGMRIEMLLPFPEPEFIDRSVLPSAQGAGWSKRFYAAKAGPHTSLRTMPTELGTLPKHVDPFERCNLWLLYSALGWGPDKVRFVCLWNGGGGDGPGGTAHMYNEVKRRTGRVSWIDTRAL